MLGVSFGTRSPLGRFVDKILRDEKPADLSVQQLSVFELVIHLKTEKALSVIVPPSLLQQADQLIE